MPGSTVLPAPFAAGIGVARAEIVLAGENEAGIGESPFIGINQDLRARTSFAPIIKKVSPSVVNIYSTLTLPDRQMGNRFFDDPFFRHFFGEFAAANANLSFLGPNSLQTQQDSCATSLTIF